MVDTTKVKTLKDINSQIVALNSDELIERDKWGEITFEKCRSDFDRIFWLCTQLQAYPVELLPNSILDTFITQLNNVYQHLNNINNFSIKNGNPEGTRDSFASNLHNSTDNLYLSCVLWIPFLAHQQGDVERNIKNLSKSVADAEQLVAVARDKIKNDSDEIENIIKTAREASAGAGAAVFTEDFSREAKLNNASAKKWLITTVVMAIITLIVAIVFWCISVSVIDRSIFIQILTTKIFILAVLFTGTIWCGKNYKSMRHLAIINNHRAISLLTLQAFSNAANDVQVKDAVLLEATRAVFGTVPTGFVNANLDSDLKLVEIARNIMPKTE